MACPGCGAPTDGAARFCAACGKPLPPLASQKASTTDGPPPSKPPIAWGRRCLSLGLGVIALVIALRAFHGSDDNCVYSNTCTAIAESGKTLITTALGFAVAAYVASK